MERILDAIFPQTCTICGKLDHSSLCKKCQIELENIQEPNILSNFEEEKYFNELIYVFKYEGLIRKLLIQYKFQEKPYIVKSFVNFLLNDKKIFKKIKSFDIIIPVPISTKRKKDRGYNQSLLLAKEISKKTGQIIANNCLYKTKNIIEQSKLNKEERKLNIQGVYEFKNEQIITNKKILLIDDIYTTGSTANECCKMLQKGKPKKIGVFTVAKD